MNYKFLILIISIFLFAGCNQHSQKNESENLSPMLKYQNTGFALIYSENLKKNKKISKKIDSRSILIFHKTLKKKSFVKITNPINQKTIIAQVASNNVYFSDFYNSVITSRIAEELSLDLNEPSIDLFLIL